MVESEPGSFVRHLWLMAIILACTAILAWASSAAHGAPCLFGPAEAQHDRFHITNLLDDAAYPEEHRHGARTR